MLNNNITISKKYHYKHLTPSNRGQIQACRNEGKSIRFIAKMLGKSPSTISRELKRNSVTQMDSSYAFKNVYIGDTAHILYKKNKTEVYLPQAVWPSILCWAENGKNEACIITLVDRKSRYTYILFLAKLNAENVNKALHKLFRKIGKKNFKGQRLWIQQAGRAGKQKYESVLCTSILLVRTWNKRKHKRTDKGVPSEREEHEWKREGNIRNTKNFKWEMQKNTELSFSRRVSFW